MRPTASRTSQAPWAAAAIPRLCVLEHLPRHRQMVPSRLLVLHQPHVGPPLFTARWRSCTSEKPRETPADRAYRTARVRTCAIENDGLNYPVRPHTKVGRKMEPVNQLLHNLKALMKNEINEWTCEASRFGILFVSSTPVSITAQLTTAKH